MFVPTVSSGKYQKGIMMKTIVNFGQLEEYGFNVLTGEACGIGRRILCDLNLRGLRIFCEANGLKVPTRISENEPELLEMFWQQIRAVFNPAWNNAASCKEDLLDSSLYVASVMVDPLDWGFYALFALLESYDFVAENVQKQMYFASNDREELAKLITYDTASKSHSDSAVRASNRIIQELQELHDTELPNETKFGKLIMELEFANQMYDACTQEHFRYYRKAGGFRNTHSMSGRIE